MPKKTRTINQGRRAINAIISNIIGADCKKLQNLQDEQIFQMYLEAKLLNQNWMKLNDDRGVSQRIRKRESYFIQLTLNI
ncbi:hypothetical protein AYP97_09835 [Lactobacillus crispatus]|uniref:hypothetical protein n=1 Tax=Lactobacillus TaxID=1578 RepID=UPI000B5DB919|nr:MULTISPECIES: hypothetical protein [Lactobacillus]OXC16528.1 hypothetical protein AYP78_02670 [Lactobacillus crispatus]OXC18535.1 hypothetical protein AYP79_04920 [Lactobacillus crispatus]OXC20358.1 hypothetical protein AYP80_00930 [Lactobacillus crispatus]OXC29527.1 hypothetical protein AYP85_05045 [Lactobacillus crispatus]OXC41721.1 hypothetical protein AYP95_02040 [Lactobacillus crispatus]